ncbi:phospholipase D-like domain-containing protein [Clostridium chromiireducens]|uniref:Phospholipase D-like domain-containing protein n=1 Tax=Clostridium chromiireducens TaxID=225345 RepID=A0A1V4IVE3_9CLOT|nr:phospholipase D-like domain-containing protein [Clostridium chromiireducens]OPJ63906.1 hypothetical protein CLCHR_14250 [Clostridium chromiireducens]
MKNNLLYSEGNKENNKFSRTFLSEKLSGIKNIIKHRIKNVKSENKEDLNLESAKKQFEEFKAKKLELERYETELLKYDDEIKDMDYCLITSNDLNSVINCKKNSLYQRFFEYKNIHIDVKAINGLIFFDKESLAEIEAIIDKLDKDEITIEKTYEIHKFSVEKICDLYISYEDEKYIIKNIEPLNKEILGTLNEIASKYEEYHLQNREIRDHFIKAFSDAKHELNIASPWMNNYVVNENLIEMMEGLLTRGGAIKIIYGIGENSSSYHFKRENSNKNKNSDRIAKKLEEKFKHYGNRFKIRKVNSHNKLLICDESYYIETSFNLLSFSGEYDSDSKDTRDEGATFSTNTEVIKDLRSRYFNF